MPLGYRRPWTRMSGRQRAPKRDWEPAGRFDRSCMSPSARASAPVWCSTRCRFTGARGLTGTFASAPGSDSQSQPTIGFGPAPGIFCGRASDHQPIRCRSTGIHRDRPRCLVAGRFWRQRRTFDRDFGSGSARSGDRTTGECAGPGSCDYRRRAGTGRRTLSRFPAGLVADATSGQISSAIFPCSRRNWAMTPVWSGPHWPRTLRTIKRHDALRRISRLRIA